MSEDFDREAEKRRLREKLEDDQESRKATEHMSDLLLKGATMTNHHCDACGDPIFRYDGREFCPTCGETVEDDGPEPTGSTDVEIDDGEANEGENDTRSTARDATAEETDDGATDPRPSPASHQEITERSGRSTGANMSGGVASGRSPERDTGGTAETPHPERPQENLGEARASLVRTLSDLAARAEATDDPRRARDLLEAAREAAETVAALDRRGR